MTVSKQPTFKLSLLTRFSPFGVVLVYFSCGMLWILLTDTIAGNISPDVGQYQYFSFLKGLLFMVLSSCMIYGLTRMLLGELQSSANILQAAFQSSPDAICVNRLSDGRFMKVNSGFTTMSGYAEADVIGRPAHDFNIWASVLDYIRLKKMLKEGQAVKDFKAKFTARDGQRFSGSVSAHKVAVEGVECVVTIVRDRTTELAARDRIHRLANYDEETGLPNYHLFMDRCNHVITQDIRERRKTVVIYISLTGFKAIVDVMGHSGGSHVMKALSRRISDTLRQYDTVARVHRDEFAIMLSRVESDSDVANVISRLQQIFALPLVVESGEFSIPACIGVACFPADGLTAEILVQNAHIAMNQARQIGVTTQFYSESMNRKAHERYNIEAGMLRAIDEGEFFLCYQPKVLVDGLELAGMEALVRWRRPGEGIIPPDMFIGVAEENGMILRLGGWVLHEACRQNKAWQDAGLLRVPVSVNISARQLMEKTFVEQVLSVLDSTGLEPGYLELELTESAIMANSEDTVQKLIRLKGYGIAIAVDDFGTGYSSLSYLKHLPIDTIKVDRSFVRDLVNDSDDAAIVEATIAMAHAMNLQVVAEGVESFEQLEFLGQQSCNQAQGYYFSRPLEAAAFEEYLQSGVKVAVQEELPVKQSLACAVVENPGLPEVEHLLPVVVDERSGCVEDQIGQICRQIEPACPSDSLSSALKRFQTEKGLLVLPVVEDGTVVGILNRSTFLEEHVIGMHGFAFQINHSKKIRDLMNPVLLVFEADNHIRDVAMALQAEGLGVRVDNVCVTSNGVYKGIVDVNMFINAITEINLSLAKGANPLTGLPGNESIQRAINDRLNSSIPFDIAYIDVDHFKPYNDYYGFQRGDEVIKTLAEIVVASCGEDDSFCGHIGGDDFIVITGPHMAQGVARRIIQTFEAQRRLLHGDEDFNAGIYVAVNRKGDQETFQLLSLSIGIVNTELTPVDSYGALASISTDVKKLAKQEIGSSIFINRRKLND